MDIGGTLDAIAANMGASVEGDAIMMGGGRGVEAGSAIEQFLLKAGESPDEWAYAAEQVSGGGGQLLKAWVRWNLQEVAAYIEADPGDVVSHALPYIY